MFWRYHMETEPWPSFHDRLAWYPTKLLAKVDASPFEKIGAESHRQACNEAYARAQCRLLKGTHTGRREGCKLADMLDVPDAQMRRLGRWDHSRMTQHYSTGIPKQGARIMAGHGSDPGIMSVSYF